MLLTRWSTPLALAALVLGAAPALTVAPAGAAPAPKPWVSVSGPAAFSPNGDGRQDTAKVTIKVKKRAAVTVRVIRNGKVLRGPVKLGVRKAGATFSWTWNGKDAKGRRVTDAVADGSKGYQVKVVARALKKQKRKSLQKVAALHAVTVDTDAGLPAAARLVADSDIVFPETTVVHDRIMFRATGADEVAAGTLVIRSGNQTIREIDSRRWSTPDYYGFHVPWDGKAADGSAVEWSRWGHPTLVTARLRVEDAVGNVAETPPLTIEVSQKRLGLRTAEVTIAPQQTRFIPTPWDCGPNTGNGCPDSFPCGTVVPSTLATMPQGLSYRAKACANPVFPNLQPRAVARHFLDLPGDAVRGGAAVSVTMRGRATVEGESDTAQVSVADGSATSAATTGETSTTASRGHDIAQSELYDEYGGFGRPVWSVQTFDDDSYDVGEFTVRYAYLAPQP